jgi:hypothetical protein
VALQGSPAFRMNLARLDDVRAEAAHWALTPAEQQVHDLYAAMAVVRASRPVSGHPR